MNEKLIDIIKGIKLNNILLPHFQREFVWNKTQQKKLILSVLTKLPASSSLLLKRKPQDTFKCLKIGMRNEHITSFGSGDCWYVLDGQQRFSTLFYAFNNIFISSKKKNEEEFEKLDNKLRKRWFLRLRYKENKILNFDNLIFNPDAAERLLPEDLDSFLDFEEIKKVSISDRSKDLEELEERCKRECEIPLIFIAETATKVQLKRILKKIFDDRLDEITSKKANRLHLETILTEKSYPCDDHKKDIDLFYDKDEQMVKEVNEFIEKKSGLKDEWVDGVYDFFHDNLKDYKIQPIEMEDRNKAVKTFEYINTGGTNLSAFDLLCAKVGHFDLRKRVVELTTKDFDFYDRSFKTNKFTLIDNFGLIKGSTNPSVEKKYADYLSQVLNLIYHREDGKFPLDGKENSFNTNLLKTKYSLDNLDDSFIEKYYEEAVDVIKKSCAILQVFCAHRNVTTITNYLSLIQVFIFFIYATDSDLTADNIKKVIGLIWLKLFTGRYNSHQNEHSIEDAIDMYQLIFIDDNKVKKTLKGLITNSLLNVDEFATKELLTTKKCNESLEQNIFKFLRSNETKFLDLDDPSKPTKIKIDDEIDIHHIIPLATATTIKISSSEIRKDKDHLLNATMNKTPIRSVTNKIIGSKNIGSYSDDIEQFRIQFSYHKINVNWAISYKKTGHQKIKELFEARFDELLNSLNIRINDYLDL